MKYPKTTISVVLCFGLLLVFSLLVIGKLIKADVSPDALLLADEIKVENRVVPTLSGGEGSGNGEMTITFDKNTSYILAVIEGEGGKKKYELITPSKILDSKPPYDDKKVQNFLMQIVSGSGDVNAAHCRGSHLACSGFYTDPMGYLRPYCWCTY